MNNRHLEFIEGDETFSECERRLRCFVNNPSSFSAADYVYDLFGVKSKISYFILHRVLIPEPYFEQIKSLDNSELILNSPLFAPLFDICIPFDSYRRVRGDISLNQIPDDALIVKTILGECVLILREDKPYIHDIHPDLIKLITYMTLSLKKTISILDRTINEPISVLGITTDSVKSNLYELCYDSVNKFTLFYRGSFSHFNLGRIKLVAYLLCSMHKVLINNDLL